MKPNAIIVHPADNVAIALEDIGQGEDVRTGEEVLFRTISSIAYSHKVLLEDVATGQDVIKYGEIIGQAAEDLKQGEWVHTHNLTIKGE
ncbi:MAG: UxaA family hydrolase [Desulfatibacillum sp.]|nr:UxaA family hydrolase [Desulfatibacillum sp.]